MSSFRHLASAISIVTLLAAPPVLAQQPEPAGGPAEPPDLASGLAGAYLAGRVAVASDNFLQMALNYDRILQADPENAGFRELAMQGYLLAGDFLRAAELAAEAVSRESGSQVAQIILQADEFKREAHGAVLAAMEDGRQTGPLTDALAKAWAYLGMGSMSDARTAFDAIINDTPDLAPFAVYHKALALAYAGDMEGASDLLTGDVDGPVSLSRRGIVAHITILSQLGRFDAALELATGMFGQNPEGDVAQIMAELADGRPVPFTIVQSARDGMAETYLLLASALIGEQGDWLPLIYARLALALRPDHPDAILLAGELLEQVAQYDLAQQVYDQMPQDDPQFLNAQLGKANALYRAGDTDAAIDWLQGFVADTPDSIMAFSTLGDMLRQEERFEEAAAAYARAIDLIGDVEERHWMLLFTYAIALERMGDWDSAETQFRRALEFVPDEPQVLNYLGYSLVEQQRNLDEALDMIERAVAGEPDSGYIVDSLGWALFRMGQYEDAVPVMERAVELMPNDPILNDHLGDVYWAVGRHREARFQWSRAISFAPHPDLDLDRVRSKLDVGLDAVLAEEGAPALGASNE
ncbi:tetratricopeptide repeat protein [Roseinatronobacter alkalisoli]|uniref:Tetratricopeptide repeat protein n=1 Tax=Roseinatronobacter alkalisoli TaxID=3028235 RepID=A0ABT5T9L5_9RHOB|nr:tetratricopeptide repeat protein [Roseinatronobacter sp. HJB301]MDD7971816.1 tetratricopeptide repeat protein [Roseinatronobacter sp. HJB301]